MRKPTRILSLVFLIAVLAACAPAATPTQVAPLDETSKPVYHLDLPPLDDPQVEADLSILVGLQADRSPETLSLIKNWHTRPVVTWNEQSRYWVAYHGMDPVVATRLYAMVSVSQQRALDALAQADNDFASRHPAFLQSAVSPVEIVSDPFESAVLIGATEPIFVSLLTETENLTRAMMDEARQSLLTSGNILPSDLEAAEAFGRTFAIQVMTERADDGSENSKEFNPFPVGDGFWYVDPFRASPERPGWGRVTPWLMSAPDEFRAPPPPAFGSVGFQSALEDVYNVQVEITHEQMAIAQKWADKRFTFTPPGHWNLIAADLILEYGLDNVDASRVFSAMNMAIMDAGIACWDSKYHYLVIRPWQADTRIASLVGYPNHPSYPSGHSCFSGASAEALGYFFPAEKDTLWQLAEEASISRLYGGIHYEFDLTAGKEIGRQVGDLMETFAVGQGWSPFTP
jgi:hypothetical protein